MKIKLFLTFKPSYSGTLTYFNIFSRSRGFVSVRDTAPEIDFILKQKITYTRDQRFPRNAFFLLFRH